MNDKAKGRRKKVGLRDVRKSLHSVAHIMEPWVATIF
jgi:hypothetical protein